MINEISTKEMCGDNYRRKLNKTILKIRKLLLDKSVLKLCTLEFVSKMNKDWITQKKIGNTTVDSERIFSVSDRRGSEYKNMEGIEQTCGVPRNLLLERPNRCSLSGNKLKRLDHSLGYRKMT